uniref:hypothetical protein n=1 Tax=Pseudomonas sp. EA_35y_Pfl1_P108 TaxID=3088688 RepID=UPI0030DC87EC
SRAFREGEVAVIGHGMTCVIAAAGLWRSGIVTFTDGQGSLKKQLRRAAAFEVVVFAEALDRFIVRDMLSGNQRNADRVEVLPTLVVDALLNGFDKQE